MDVRGTLSHCYAFLFCERAELDQHNRVTVHRVLSGSSCARGAHDVTAYVCLGLASAAPGIEVQINVFDSTGRLMGHSHAEIPCDQTGIAQGALILREVTLSEPGHYRAELQTRGGEILASWKIVVEDAAAICDFKPSSVRAIANPV